MASGKTTRARWSGAKLLRLGWFWLRQVSGDAAYDNYLRCAQRHAKDVDPSGYATRAEDAWQTLTRAEFYLDSVRRRYSSVSRCC